MREGESGRVRKDLAGHIEWAELEGGGVECYGEEMEGEGGMLLLICIIAGFGGGGRSDGCHVPCYT